MNPTASKIEDLDRLRGIANAAVINAQREYESLSDHEATDHSLWGAAWLKVWNAEQQQRQIFRALDQLEGSQGL